MRGWEHRESDEGGNRMNDVKVEKDAGTGRTGWQGEKRRMSQKEMDERVSREMNVGSEQ